MNEVGKEYGAALYLLACEQNREEQYKNELEALSTLLGEQKDYMDFLLSPNVPMQKRIEALGEVCSALVSPDVVSFMQLLCEKGRLVCFEEAKATYLALYEDAARIVKVKIRSAVELTDEEKQRLHTKLEAVYAARVFITYEVEPSLIGGVVMETDDKVTDGSLRHRLQEVKEVMSR